MGKAVIVSEQGEGLYTVKKEVRGLAAARALAADRRERLEAEFPPLRLEEENALNAVVSQRFVTDTLLNDWLAGIEIPEDTLNFELRYGISDEARAYVQAQTTGLEVPAALMNAIHELVEKRMLLDDIRRKLDRKSAEYLAVLKWQGQLTALQNSADTPIPAWCADYTGGLAGTVATLEVPGEVDPLIGGGLNIKPGYTDEATWSASYGQIQFGKTLSPAGFAWNMTMLTPWLKWMPIWRYATVTAVDKDADTVNVNLLPVLSKVGAYLRKDLTINDPWLDKMTGIPVEYMSCGAGAFEVGDEVIIEFRPPEEDMMDAESNPYCIGFKDNPKPCNVFFYSDLFIPVFLGIYDDSAPIEWVESKKYSGEDQDRIRIAEAVDGVIFGWLEGPGGRIVREKNNETVWSINTGDYFFTMNYDPFNDRIITADPGTGYAEFYDPATGAHLGRASLAPPLQSQDDIVLVGAGADASNGDLIYATSRAPRAFVEAAAFIHIGATTINLHAIYSGSNAYIEGLCCSEDFIFVLIYNGDNSPAQANQVMQLNKSGGVMSIVATPGGFKDSYASAGEVISGGFIVPALPPPEEEEEEEDPPP
jgi:hypothetical protein